jgi:protein disulfide-isomerase
VKIKIFFILILISVLLISCKSTGSDNLNWEERLETAIAKAQKENKFILVNFTGSDWCKWCQKLTNEVFAQKEFENFAKENLILVKIDFPKNIEQSMETKLYNNQLAKDFSVEGFPTIFILDMNGNVRLRTGYLPGGPSNYIFHLRRYM